MIIGSNWESAPSSRPVLLLAASGLAREVLVVLHQLGTEVAGILDDDPSRHGTSVGGVPVMGPVAVAAELTSCALVVCAGASHLRMIMVDRLAALGVSSDRYVAVVHPQVEVPASCRVGAGSVLLAGTVLTADVRVGRHVVIMPRVVLTHDDVVEDYATLCAGATFGGDVRIGRGAYVGMAASVREHSRVGAHATLGMGAVLVEDLPDHQTWAGVPAHRLSTSRPTPERVS